MRRRDRIILFLIALIALGTFVFAILQFVGENHEGQNHAQARTDQRAAIKSDTLQEHRFRGRKMRTTACRGHDGWAEGETEAPWLLRIA